jgi:hypothetical protein
VRHQAGGEAGEEGAEHEEEQARPELVHAARDRVRLRVAQGGERHPERRVEDAPDPVGGDREQDEADVVEHDVAPALAEVAEVELRHVQQAVAAAGDLLVGAVDEEVAEQLVEGERDQDDVDAAQPQGRQADDDRRDRGSDRREPDREPRVQTDVQRQVAGHPAADRVEGDLRERVDPGDGEEQVPRLRDDAPDEEHDQQVQPEATALDRVEEQRQHEGDREQRDQQQPARARPRGGGLVETLVEVVRDAGDRFACLDAHSRLASPTPKRPFGRTVRTTIIVPNRTGRPQLGPA